jgi:hypothetical protein
MEQRYKQEAVSSDVFANDYIPYIVKRGMTLNLLGFFVSFGPALVLTFIYNQHPPTSAIMSGFISLASVVGLFWIVEPISYFPILGIPGTYMSFLSGNIGNMRLPCAAIAQEAAGVEAGSDEGAIISTIGIAISIIVNIAILSIGVVLGAKAVAALPPHVMAALKLILPSLFGAMFAQFAITQPKLGAIGLSFALLMTYLMNNGHLGFLPGYPSYAVVMVSVFGTIVAGKKMFEKGMLS